MTTENNPSENPSQPASEIPAAQPPRNQEEWDRLLEEAGWRDGTLDPAGSTAFELPAGPPPRRRKYSPEEWRKRLLELGVREATLDPGGPTAFELPGPPHRPSEKGED